ncbi:MAG TPA: glycosyltransferase family 39 protein [Vicinamibacterales bacterium]|nr:glycosyltransferase family 39 protein [Vicinamibacterales bacterium]
MIDSAANLPARFDHLYSRLVALAELAHRHRWRVAALGAPIVALVAIGISQWVLLDFPNSGDEYNYLYEAQTFAAGRLWNTPLSPADVFNTNYIVQEPPREFSSFPFGWPIAIAGALVLGLPPWIVNPVLGTLTLALVWALGARLYDGRTGVIAAALVGSSPFFLFNAASYFSHTFCGALLLGAAFVASREERSPPWVPMLVGLLIGWAVVARYLTGVLCGVPIVFWLLRPGVPRVKTMALVAIGGLPWVGALAAYNQAMTGNPLKLTTTALTVSLWFRDGWLLRSADILSAHLLRHLLWTPAVLVPAYVIYLRTAPAATRRGPLDWILVVTIAVLYFYVERGGNQYGPRFHYEAFLFAVIFVAGNLFRADSLQASPPRDRWLFALLAASVILMPISFAVHAAVEHRVVLERMDPFRRAAGLRDAVVLIGDRVGATRSIAAPDLTRNGINPGGPVLYGLHIDTPRHCPGGDLAVPGRAPYLYVWDYANGIGTLTPLECSASATLPPR